MYQDKKSRIRIVASIILFIFAVAFSLTLNTYTPNSFTLGDEILKLIHLPSWSEGDTGTHYTIFYSFAMMIISYCIWPKSQVDKKN